VGVRGDASFMGTIVQQPSGALSGTFTIVILPGRRAPHHVRYEQFTPLQVKRQHWIFDGTGPAGTVRPVRCLQPLRVH